MPYCTIGGARFHFKVHGEGRAHTGPTTSGGARRETIVFISGMGGDNSDWYRQLPSHARRYRCVTFDNRGMGGSLQAAAGMDSTSYSMELLADDTAALMDALDIPRAHIVGASMGGVVAQHFALRHPERAITMSAHSTLGRIGALSRLKFGLQQTMLERCQVSDVLLSLAPMIWSEYTLEHRQGIVQAFRARRMAKPVPIPRETYLLQLSAFLRTDLLGRIGALKMPVLVTAGADDGLIPPGESLAIHKAVHGSEYHLFPRCGHATVVENPRGFNMVSLRFMGAHPGGRP